MALTALLGGHLLYGGYLTPLPLSVAPRPLPVQMATAFVQATWNGSSSPQSDAFLQGSALCWLTGYRGGYPVHAPVSLWDSREHALATLLQDPTLREMEAVEVGTATELDEYHQEVLPPESIGLWGLLLRCANGELCLTPASLARRAQTLEAQSLKYRNERTVFKEGKFRALSWVLRRDQGFTAVPVVRGEAIIEPSPIEPAVRAVAAYEERLAAAHEGQLPFVHRLGTGVDSDEGRSLVSVCMGSLSLAEYARWTGKESDRQLSERHLRTMIARFGHRDRDRAWIADTDDALLGAQGLFALALHIQRGPSDLAGFEAALNRGILASRQSDGHFTTSVALPGSSAVKPVDPEKDPLQNLYPGLALSYLASRGDLGPLVDGSLDYYRKRFTRHPDRAAVAPLAEAWLRRDGDPSGAYELVDWNLRNLQLWSEMESELRGAPINPANTHFGPTCQSYEAGATLRALAAAEQLALHHGERARAQHYREALGEVSRYLMQMQVRSAGDLYWLPPTVRLAAVGGVRDCAWESTMQIDSSASALEGWLEYLR